MALHRSLKNKRKLNLIDDDVPVENRKDEEIKEVDIDFTNTTVDENADDSSDADNDDDLDDDDDDDGERDVGFSSSDGENTEGDSENEVSTSGYGVGGSDDSDDLSFEESESSEGDDDGLGNSSEIGHDENSYLKKKNLLTENSIALNNVNEENISKIHVIKRNKIKGKHAGKADSSNSLTENAGEENFARMLISKKNRRKDEHFGKSEVKVDEAAVTSKDDEYANDSSDEEDIRNTVGNIPMKWYDDYEHLGYDWDGKKILKPPQGDALDNFLKRMEDPNFWRTVKDPQTGQDVILCDADVDLIQRLQSQKVPDPEFDEYAPWVEWFSSEVMQMPVRKFPEHKRSFLPSQLEKQKVSRIVHAIKMGWIKPRQRKKVQKGPKFYMLWQSDDSAEQMRRIHNHIPAPKRSLPGHAESYNPPSEYLFDKRELKLWRKLKTTPWKRKLHFIPEKYGSLRQVPAYKRYIRERFLRCLDLYLCPRARKMKLMIEPEDLVPQLPSPQDLQPFPTTQSLVYEGHSDLVRSITVESRGQYLASGSDDLTVKIWEVATTRCVRTVAVGGVVRSVSWCPNQALSLIAVAADRKVLLINPRVGDRLVVTKTDTLLRDPPQQDVIVPERVKACVQWEEVSDELWDTGVCIIINHFKEVKQVTWHGRGDYFATVMPEGQNRSVLIHQLSKRRSQLPFSRARGLVQCVLFHPIRPIFFVATQKHVRVYDLVKQEMIKKLMSNSKWISSIAVHPGGDNVLVGTYDRKMLWFDLDLSTKPYQTLRLHGTAVRSVAYHTRYPLFASGSDDRSVIVCHGMVYNDLLQNPLIVPLKRLSYHEPKNDFGVLDVVFHPTQPWVFSSGGDHTIRLYT